MQFSPTAALLNPRPAAHVWLLCTAGTAVQAVRLLTGSNTSLSAGTWQHMHVQAAAEAEAARSEVGGGGTATVLTWLQPLRFEGVQYARQWGLHGGKVSAGFAFAMQ
jgi:hypothetical protein